MVLQTPDVAMDILDILGDVSSHGDLATNSQLVNFGLLRLMVSLMRTIHDADMQLKKQDSKEPLAGVEFRSPIMRIIANLSFENPEAQDIIIDEGHFLCVSTGWLKSDFMMIGGLPAILASSVVDERSPILRGTMSSVFHTLLQFTILCSPDVLLDLTDRSL